VRYVIALGGNALSPPGGTHTAEEQMQAVAAAMASLAPVAVEGHELLITHGNGPQVGNLLLKNELAAHLVPAMPLDWCVAQTQATIGLAIQSALERELHQRGSVRGVVVVLTRVKVDPLDPARLRPSKPIGRELGREEALAQQAPTRHFAEQAGGTWRRVVASPEPIEVVEEADIRKLLAGGSVVVAAGGGGVPVEEGEDGRLFGVEAVIDKDLTASLLARRLGADALVILTGVPGAAVDFGRPQQRFLKKVTAEELRGFQAAGHFSEGSMAPKVEAALRFVEAGGRRASIAPLEDAALAVAGRSGTQLVRG
jgi:carbamate kinase